MVKTLLSSLPLLRHQRREFAATRCAILCGAPRARSSRKMALPEIVAHHFEQAGDTVAAITHWGEAARRAAAQGAHAEALNHLTRALTLLENLPLDAARNLLTCDLLLQQAGSMRVLDRFDEAFEVLSQAEALALEPDDARRLADICFLRGNLHFPRGDFNGCQEQHARSLALAQRVGNPERQARALSGLGDASYMRGAMITAFGHFDRCVELGRQQNLPNIVAANQVMRGLARFYQNDVDNGLADVEASVQLAEEIGALRAALVAYTCLSIVFLDIGHLDDLCEPMERIKALCEVTGARRFVCRYFMTAGLICMQKGDPRRAQELVEEAFATCEESGAAFQGAATLGTLALVAEDEAVRADALQVSAQHGQWSELERYAERLAAYTRDEPLPYTDLFIARGRALARFGRDPRDGHARAELLRVRAEALRIGLHSARLPASVEAAVVA